MANKLRFKNRIPRYARSGTSPFLTATSRDHQPGTEIPIDTVEILRAGSGRNADNHVALKTGDGSYILAETLGNGAESTAPRLVFLMSERRTDTERIEKAIQDLAKDLGLSTELFETLKLGGMHPRA